jgi:hypothetical protein
MYYGNAVVSDYPIIRSSGLATLHKSAEAEVGLDQSHKDWQEKMESKKGKNKG